MTGGCAQVMTGGGSLPVVAGDDSGVSDDGIGTQTDDSGTALDAQPANMSAIPVDRAFVEEDEGDDEVNGSGAAEEARIEPDDPFQEAVTESCVDGAIEEGPAMPGDRAAKRAITDEAAGLPTMAPSFSAIDGGSDDYDDVDDDLLDKVAAEDPLKDPLHEKGRVLADTAFLTMGRPTGTAAIGRFRKALGNNEGFPQNCKDMWGISCSFESSTIREAAIRHFAVAVGEASRRAHCSTTQVVPSGEPVATPKATRRERQQERRRNKG